MKLEFKKLINMCGGESESDMDIFCGGMHVGAVYYFGGLKGHSLRPWNLIFKQRDEGMFESVDEVKQFINSTLM